MRSRLPHARDRDTSAAHARRDRHRGGAGGPRRRPRPGGGRPRGRRGRGAPRPDRRPRLGAARRARGSTSTWAAPGSPTASRPSGRRPTATAWPASTIHFRPACAGGWASGHRALAAGRHRGPRRARARGRRVARRRAPPRRGPAARRPGARGPRRPRGCLDRGAGAAAARARALLFWISACASRAATTRRCSSTCAGSPAPTTGSGAPRGRGARLALPGRDRGAVRGDRRRRPR